MSGRAPRPVRRLHHDTGDRPFIVIWEVTRACALACLHCRADAIVRRDPRELTTAEGFRLLDQLASFGAPRPLVVLTGGDPFERPDLTELVAYGTSLGLSVSLAPSVTPRLDRTILTALRDAGAKAVSVSVDGASAATHDAFRGVPGVFDATTAAVATVRDLGLRLQVNTTVTGGARGTVRELPQVLRAVLDAGASLWSLFFLVPTGRGRALEPLTPAEQEDVLHWLHEIGDLVAVKATEAAHFRRLALQRAAAAEAGQDLDEAFPPGALRRELRAGTALALGGVERQRRTPRAPTDVNAGRGFAFVDHVGDVYPSGFLPVRAGSVRDDDFPTLYRTATLLRDLRDPARLGGRCGVCEFQDVCGGSRAQAFAATGDPLAEDPTCTWVPLLPRPDAPAAATPVG
ncbi:TIGR04053 family radical SAM/SPASM domain-containing protein [Cellulomonas carbonis]|uniref:Pyrroloquinoline quinone biosynthesis protein PqqE n=1 Tax=Cellulomonas carbonis T26 TaxID=947969 RepID=A0A0A0BWR7_9CELL|nr:TIGR04053 family radical SAM/SPASM domain-containing protein [Cellulomonas carbonis]KGM12361.1 pyrroloquinoline quinone biosynthesis protein PqqE [Cellulomonas carbonis T26]GGC03627.1 heme b synthase [Cellulomonas carbonis]